MTKRWSCVGNRAGETEEILALSSPASTFSCTSASLPWDKNHHTWLLLVPDILEKHIDRTFALGMKNKVPFLFKIPNVLFNDVLSSPQFGSVPDVRQLFFLHFITFDLQASGPFLARQTLLLAPSWAASVALDDTVSPDHLPNCNSALVLFLFLSAFMSETQAGSLMQVVGICQPYLPPVRVPIYKTCFVDFFLLPGTFFLNHFCSSYYPGMSL